MANWSDIANAATQVVNALAPVIEAAVPGSAEAIAIGTKIAQGVIDAEPTAIALYNKIKSGEVPTKTEITAYETGYEAAYKALHDDLAAKIAATKD